MVKVDVDMDINVDDNKSKVLQDIEELFRIERGPFKKLPPQNKFMFTVISKNDLPQKYMLGNVLPYSGVFVYPKFTVHIAYQ